MASIIKQINSDNNIIYTLNVAELEKAITYAANKYYTTDNPVLTDELYDLLIDCLRELNDNSKVLKQVDTNIKGDSEKLEYFMGSMQKIKPYDEKDMKYFNKWVKEYKGNYYISDKLDGVSILLIYKKNGDIKLFTRGKDGVFGTNISHLIQYLNIPVIDKNYICSNKDNKLVLRGEFIIKKNNFEKYFTEYKNPRNAIIGFSIKYKSIDINLITKCDLVFYEVIDPYLSINEQFDILKNIKCNYVHHVIVDKINTDILNDILVDRKENSLYNIDGIIIYDNSKTHIRDTEHVPDYAFAYKNKFTSQITKIIDVKWSISKSGKFIPVCVIEPIIIDGKTMNNISTYNAKYIKNNNIGVGTIVKVCYSGEVIPKIIEVIKSTQYSFPNDIEWEWDETETNIILTNNNNDEMKIKQLISFFEVNKTAGMGPGTINILYQHNINTIQKILNLKYDDLIDLPTFQDKKITTLLLSIKKMLKETTLSKIMSGSGLLGIGLGSKRIQLILDEYPNLLENKWTKEEFIENITKIDMWNTKTAELFVNNFKKFINFYNEIKHHIIVKDKIKCIKSELNDKSIVFSGFRDKILEHTLVNDYGVNVTSSVSKNTFVIITKDNNNNSSKIQKAINIGINVVTLNEFKKKYNL